MSDKVKTAPDNQRIESMKQGIREIMAGAKRVDPACKMPPDHVWQRQAKALMEQRATSLLATLTDQEIAAVANGDLSMEEVWATV